VAAMVVVLAVAEWAVVKVVVHLVAAVEMETTVVAMAEVKAAT